MTLVAVIGVGGLTVLVVGLWLALRPAPGVNPEKRAGTRCQEEETVKKWVLDHAHDPASVEFDTWGPHDLQAELGLKWPPMDLTKLGKFAGLLGQEKKTPRPAQVVRVTFRGKNTQGAKEYQDALFFIQDGKVVAADKNPWGDGWKTGAKSSQELLDGLWGNQKGGLDDWFNFRPSSGEAPQHPSR